MHEANSWALCYHTEKTMSTTTKQRTEIKSVRGLAASEGLCREKSSIEYFIIARLRAAQAVATPTPPVFSPCYHWSRYLPLPILMSSLGLGGESYGRGVTTSSSSSNYSKNTAMKPHIAVDSPFTTPIGQTRPPVSWLLPRVSYNVAVVLARGASLGQLLLPQLSASKFELQSSREWIRLRGKSSLQAQLEETRAHRRSRYKHVWP